MVIDIKNIDEFLSDVLKSVAYSNEKEIIDNKTGKKSKKKSRLKNNDDDGLELLKKDEIEYISFGDIPKGRTFNRNKNIENWNTSDFVICIRDIYKEKMEDHWDFNFGGVCLEVTRIHDDIAKQNGFCNNLILRDYIYFYFKQYAKRTAKKAKGFYFSNMRHYSPISHFLGKYNFCTSLKSEVEKRKQEREKEEKNIVDKKSLKKSFLIGEENFLCEYGIVLFVNWLILIKNISKVQAIKKSLFIIKDLYQSNKFTSIIEETISRAPYPSFFPFQKIDLFLKKIDGNLKIEGIEFLTDKKLKNIYEFMRVESENLF